jgi:hypothetical protein
MIRPELLRFFARALSPRARVVVFQEVKAPGLAIIECPFTHQRVYAVSGPLWWEVRNAIYCETRRDIASEFEIEYTKESRLQFLFVEPNVPVVSSAASPHPPERSRTLRVVLEPTPIPAWPRRSSRRRSGWSARTSSSAGSGHALVTHRSGFHVDQRRVDGHIFMACEHCKPSTYFFGVVHSRPSPIVYCYAITEEQHRYWRNTTDEELRCRSSSTTRPRICYTAWATTPAISGERCEEERAPHPPAARRRATHARAGAELGAEEAKSYWSEGRQCPREALTGLDETLNRALRRLR